VLAGGEPVVSMVPAGGATGRARVDLVLLGGTRRVDVSVQPSAADGVVRARARRCGHDPNGWAGALAVAVAADARTWGCWADAGGATDLVRTLGGLAHPLLGLAYDAGADRVEEVPRWAAPALAAATVAEGAAALVGGRRATRAVVRSFGTWLARPGWAWWTLALVVASAAAEALEPDDLARTLTTDGRPPSLRAASAPAPADVRELTAALRRVGPSRARPLVHDAASSGGERRLADALRLLGDVDDDVPRPLPTTVAALEAACLRAAAVDPGPPPAPPSPPRPAAPAPTPPTPPPPVRATLTVPLRAPATAAPRPPAATRLRPSALAQRLAGTTADGRYDVVLPRTAGELTTWGRLLGNCLGDFAAAVAAGETVVAGVRDRSTLIGALEVRDGRLVQLLGHRNRPVAAKVAAAVVAHVDGVLARAVRR
jgi:hypothetical protein